MSAGKDNVARLPAPANDSEAPKAPPQKAPTALPKAARPRRPTDQAFLPAAIEVLETPPSPVRMALLLAICALFTAAVVWGWFGKIDVVAIAPGRIQPTGRVRVIQAAETGRIVAVNVKNGSAVKAGEALLELDPREAEADLQEFATEFASTEAEALRRRAALKAAAATPPAAPAIDWPDDIPEVLRMRETLVLQGDVGKLAAELASLDAQRNQKVAEQARLETTIAAQQELLATQGMRVDMRTELIRRDAGSKAQLIDAEEVRQLQRVTLAEQQGQLQETRAALALIEREKTRFVDTFVAENSQKLADVENRVDDNRQRLAKAQARLEHMTISAPISGSVTALAVSSPGQVVTTGEEVMRLVPDGSRLELEAYMPNRDIGFIQVDQPVSVKVDSFPFTRYGMLDGTVTHVARDAVSEASVRQNLISPSGGAALDRGGRDAGHAEPRLPGHHRAGEAGYPGRRRLGAAGARHDGPGGDQDRPASHSRISLLASGRGRFGIDEGAMRDALQSASFSAGLRIR